MFFFLKIVLYLIALSFSIHSFANSEQQSPCFSQSYNKPLDLYLEAYSSSRLLGWGITSHENPKPIHELSQFLDSVGSDENLRFIFVEAPAAAQELFRQISLEGTANIGLIKSQLGAYSQAYLSPFKLVNFQAREELIHIYLKVFKLNLARQNKLIVVPIDSTYDVVTNTFRHHPLSFNRENETSENFMEFYQQMKLNEKAIILYHTYHIARNVIGNTTRYIHNLPFQSVLSNLSFLGQSLIDEHEYKLIVFDQLEQSNGFVRLFKRPKIPINSTGLFKISITSESHHCLNTGNFFEKYSVRPQFQDSLDQTFNYLVYYTQGEELDTYLPFSTEVD